MFKCYLIVSPEVFSPNQLLNPNLKLSTEMISDSSNRRKNEKLNRCIKVSSVPNTSGSVRVSLYTLFYCCGEVRFCFTGSQRFNNTHAQNPSVTCAKWIHLQPLNEALSGSEQRRPCLEKLFGALAASHRAAQRRRAEPETCQTCQRRVGALLLHIIPYYIRHANAALLSVSVRVALCPHVGPSGEKSNQ